MSLGSPGATLLGVTRTIGPITRIQCSACDQRFVQVTRTISAVQIVEIAESPPSESVILEHCAGKASVEWTRNSTQGASDFVDNLTSSIIRLCSISSLLGDKIPTLRPSDSVITNTSTTRTSCGTSMLDKGSVCVGGAILENRR